LNQTKIWQNPQLPDVEFFSAHYTDFAYAPHFHEDYALGVVEHGVHAFRYRGENHAIPAGHVVTCQPGEVHNGHPGSADVWRYRMMYFRPELVQQVAAELGYQSSALPFLSYTAIGHAQAVEAVRAVHRSAEVSEPTLSQEVLLREMLALVLGSFSEIRVSPEAIRDENAPIAAARAYIHAHYAEDIQLDQLAAVAHLSKSYFIRAFRHHMGMSPYAYLVQVRLNRAKALLRAGATPVDVALATGFYDQSHFTRYFKRFMGVSPGQYQQATG
jgi:AraC-like DNA-binding protein